MVNKSVYKNLAIAALVIAASAFGAYKVAISPCLTKINDLKTKIANTETQLQDKKTLQAQEQALKDKNKATIAEISKMQTEFKDYDAKTSEEILAAFGNSSKNNGLKIVSFSDNGTTTTGQSWCSSYGIEVRGDLTGLRQFVNSLDDLNIRYSIGGVSLTEDTVSIPYPAVSDYTYRYFNDITNLSWYAENDTEKKQDSAKGRRPSAPVGKTSYDDISSDGTLKTASNSDTTTEKDTIKSMAESDQHSPEATEKKALQGYNKITSDNPSLLSIFNDASVALTASETASSKEKDGYKQINDSNIYSMEFTINFYMYKDPQTKELPVLPSES